MEAKTPAAALKLFRSLASYSKEPRIFQEIVDVWLTNYNHLVNAQSRVHNNFMDFMDATQLPIGLLRLRLLETCKKHLDDSGITRCYDFCNYLHNPESPSIIEYDYLSRRIEYEIDELYQGIAIMTLANVLRMREHSWTKVLYDFVCIDSLGWFLALNWDPEFNRVKSHLIHAYRKLMRETFMETMTAYISNLMNTMFCVRHLPISFADKLLVPMLGIHAEEMNRKFKAIYPNAVPRINNDCYVVGQEMLLMIPAKLVKNFKRMPLDLQIERFLRVTYLKSVIMFMRCNLMDFVDTVAYVAIYVMDQMVDDHFRRVQRGIGEVFENMKSGFVQLPIEEPLSLNINGESILLDKLGAVWVPGVEKPHYYVLFDMPTKSLQFVGMGLPAKKWIALTYNKDFLKRAVDIIKNMDEFSEELASTQFRNMQPK